MRDEEQDEEGGLLSFVLGSVVFLAGIFISVRYGVTGFYRFLGVTMIGGGIFWMIRRSIPVGLEDQPPSFYLRGAWAVIAGIAMTGAGLYTLTHAAQVSCWFGAAQGCA